VARLSGSRLRAGAAVLAAVVAASLAVLVWWLTGRAASSPPAGRPPSSVAGILLCRWPFAVAGYKTARSGPVVFPLTHPERPALGEPPSRCFPSFSQARGAGYRVAPPPRGMRVMGGIYLTSPAAKLTRKCRAAERQLAFSVPCPGLIPSGVVWGCEPCIDAGSFVLSGEADAPARYRGKFGENAIHLVIAGSADRTSWRVACFGATGAGTFTVRSRSVRVERCPEGSSLHSGHFLAWWERSGIRYAVSLHGSDARNRALLRVLIAAVSEGP
jgi:hypothetical protein